MKITVGQLRRIIAEANLNEFLGFGKKKEAPKGVDFTVSIYSPTISSRAKQKGTQGMGDFFTSKIKYAIVSQFKQASVNFKQESDDGRLDYSVHIPPVGGSVDAENVKQQLNDVINDITHTMNSNSDAKDWKAGHSLK
jgi:hypothetical protein